MLADNWGATPGERARSYPCDGFVPEATLQAWRALTVDAPPGHVWGWVSQIRAAPYSYDWIDNRGHRSPARLLGWPEPVVGEPFTRTGGRPQGRIVHVEPGSSLTGTIMGAFLTYWLAPTSTGATRVVLKVVADAPRGVRSLASLGDLIMARKQLLTLKSHIEDTVL